MRLEGKVAIITGASRGIGKAIARAMAREGADIVVAARTDVQEGHLPGSIYETADLVKREGRRALAVKMDITDARQIAEMVKKTMAELGRIDILVNNAGVGSTDSALEISEKRWDIIMAVNLRGTFICSKMVLPHMMARKRGHIINLSSIIALTGESSGAYGVTKAAIIHFTRGLAQEMRTHGIAVNALCPELTATEGVLLALPQLISSGKIQSPDMWGRYAALVASQEPHTFTGRVLTADDLRREFGDISS